jgi:hypothetical protein
MRGNNKYYSKAKNIKRLYKKNCNSRSSKKTNNSTG